MPQLLFQIFSLDPEHVRRSGFGSLRSSFRFSSCLCGCFLLCLCLQSCLFALLSFLGIFRLESLIALLFLLLTVKNILDRASMALRFAQTAVDGIRGIDCAESVLNCDRALRADSCALSASDTCDIACLPGICALLLVVAADLNLRGFGNDLDQLLRAGFCTGSAAGAVIATNDSYAVNDTDRVKLT